MSREVYTVIKDQQNKIVWSSVDLDDCDCPHLDIFFCGRNDETNLIAQRANWEGEEAPELDITDEKTFDDVKNELNRLWNVSLELRNKAQNRLDALYSCREHALSLKLFYEFDEEIESLEHDIDGEYWERANDMIDLMNKTRHEFDRFVSNARDAYKRYGSDFDYVNDPLGRPNCDKNTFGYRMYWVDSE